MFSIIKIGRYHEERWSLGFFRGYVIISNVIISNVIISNVIISNVILYAQLTK